MPVQKRYQLHQKSVNVLLPFHLFPLLSIYLSCFWGSGLHPAKVFELVAELCILR